MEKNYKRRRFIKNASAAGAAITAGGVLSRRVNAQQRKTPTVELIKVGVIGVGEYSHMPGIWGPTINPAVPDTWPMRSTRMVMTHVWDSHPEAAEAFAKKYNCEVVKNYYDMVDKVDGMIFGAFYEVKWWYLLTKPYLEAGIPCFINRPFSLSMKHAREIVETARKHNTPILCTDEREYIKESIIARSKVKTILGEGKNILGANSSNSAGYEYPAHGVHGLYFMLAILGLDVESVSLQADGWWNKKAPSYPHPMTWGILTLHYNGIQIDGAPEQKRPFVAVQQQLTGQNANATMKLYYNGGWCDVDNHWTHGEPLDRLYYLFFPTVFAIQRMFETKKMQWSYDYILKKTQIFLTGFKSHIDHNGTLLRVADLPEDWEAPSPKPDWIDEAIFR